MSAPSPRQLSFSDPLEVELLADKTAIDRARVYELVGLSVLERVEVEARVRLVIARRHRRRAT